MRYGRDLNSITFKLIIQTLRWIPMNHTNKKTTVVQVVAWCLQAPSDYLNQCWSRSLLHMASLSHTELNVMGLVALFNYSVQFEFGTILNDFLNYDYKWVKLHTLRINQVKAYCNISVFISYKGVHRPSFARSISDIFNFHSTEFLKGHC